MHTESFAPDPLQPLRRLGASSGNQPGLPWDIGAYFTKQAKRELDEHGSIQENVEESALFNDDAKIRLSIQEWVGILLFRR